MLPFIPALVAILTAGYLVYKYWDQIVEWASDLVPELKEFIATKMRKLASVIAFFAEKIRSAWAAIKCKVFYRDPETKKFYEQEGIKEIEESQVPADIRAKLMREQEPNITREMELQTGTSVG